MGFVKDIGKGIGSVVGEITGANSAARAATRASETQAAAAQMGIDEVRSLLAPFIGAGTQALGAQQNLLGLGGADAQAQAIQALQQSPFFQSQLQSGENRILQNASATGGLRGGNTQAALAQFAPTLLAQTVQNQLSNLGGISQLGGNAAAGQGAQVANLLGAQGAATAGGQLAQGQRADNIFGTALQLGGTALGAAGGFGGLFGGGATSALGASGVPSISGNLGQLTPVSF